MNDSEKMHGPVHSCRASYPRIYTQEDPQNVETADGTILEYATPFVISRPQGTREFVQRVMASVHEGEIIKFEEIPLFEELLKRMYVCSDLNVIKLVFGTIEITKSRFRSISEEKDLFLIRGNVNTIGAGLFQLEKPELILSYKIIYFEDSTYVLKAVFRVQSEINIRGKDIKVFIDLYREADLDITFEAPSGFTLTDIFDLFSTQDQFNRVKSLIQEVHMDCFSLKIIQVKVSLKDNFSSIIKLTVQLSAVIFGKFCFDLRIVDGYNQVFIRGESTSSHKLYEFFTIAGVKQEHLSSIPNVELALVSFHSILDRSKVTKYGIRVSFGDETPSTFNISEGIEAQITEMILDLDWNNEFQIKCYLNGTISGVEIKCEGNYNKDEGFTFCF